MQDLARFELITIIVRLVQHAAFDDRSDKVNVGGCVQKLTMISNISVPL